MIFLKKCKNCQKTIEERINYCPYCGYSLLQTNNKQVWTLEEIYTAWKKRHFRKIGNESIRSIQYAWTKLEKLYNKRFADIDIDEYQEIIDENATSYSRQHQIRNLVSLLCGYGVKYQLIPFNFGHHLILDAPKGAPKNIFSDEEIRLIAQYAINDISLYSRDAQIILCLIYTGMRPNEFFDLKKKSINLSEHYIIGGGKTAAGTNRLIPIPKAVETYFLKWCSNLKTDDEFLIQTNSGKKIDLNNWRKQSFYPLLSLLKINPPYRYGESPYKPKYVPYSCRHTFASLSARAKMDKDILCKLIGHTDPAFTEKVYIHQRINEYREEMQKLENPVDSFSL